MWRIRELLAICVALGVAPGGDSIAIDLPGNSVEKPGPGMFLVAKRSLDGPYFGQSVVYLVAHGEDGTIGLIVNRPGKISLSETVPDLKSEQTTDHALYLGGPVGLPMILLLKV